MVVYFNKTKAIPAFGGEYIEGIVGQPQHINPVLSLSNNTDDDLSQLVYSSLMKYDGQGNLENDITDSYEISDDKTTYTIHLKDNLLWHDGEKLTTEDIAFTLNLIIDPSYKSPLRYNWQSVETNVVDDKTITFKIKSPHAGFLNNLTFGILPKHIWETIEAEKFPLTSLNLEPIGSGPYKYSSIQKDSKGNIISYKLAANPNYYAGRPYISRVTFNFYADDDSAVAAFNKKEIMGISSLPTDKISAIKNIRSTTIHKSNLPRYFAIFLNQNKSVPLGSSEVREALNLATDRQEIISSVLSGNGYPIYSPITRNMVGYNENIGKKDFNLEEANKILEEAGWKKGDDGIRSKNNVVLEINLVTANWLELSATANIIKTQWEKIGARVNVSELSISDVQQNYIRTREYDALLFGQFPGGDPDPYFFWHSSQTKDPGLNLSLFGKDETDKLIEQGRVEFDSEKRSSIYKEFQEKLVKITPAIFLYSPYYVYPVRNSVKGIDNQNLVSSSYRLSPIKNWFIKTERVGK
jgi:peptide/nickel transport system substrate-binding protein